ncbi:LIC_10030 family protein [Leptospira sp. GIMC2001]|uniref:LIC_10030 family protein n=1 Tax=Leptospira sp. GIMC2001 TaxID=1513297 RepID=UPI00234964CB|nr:hypothetical protein [Leptospira sp. GIMC2001]WCL49553.1 hypothetical protein O4O04_01680 [Leptospira sp. GIMC2001]
MKLDEVAKLNKLLAGISGINIPLRIYIDNLHCPYLELEGEYILPPCSVLDGVGYDTAKQYLKEISRLVPELISGMQVLPFPRPKKDSSKLFLVQRIEGEQEFLLLIVLDVAHLGGIQNDKIVKKANQSQTISIRTNRIYFTSKIIPIEKIYIDKGNIVNFDGYEVTEWIEKQRKNVKQLETELENRIRPFSDLFDDADFSTQEKLIAEHLGINRENWRLGKVYSPIGIEHLCFSIRFLEARKQTILETWNMIRDSFWDGLTSNENLEKGVTIALHNYLSNFDSKLEYSQSDNPRWLITKRA